VSVWLEGQQECNKGQIMSLLLFKLDYARLLTVLVFSELLLNFCNILVSVGSEYSFCICNVIRIRSVRPKHEHIIDLKPTGSQQVSKKRLN